MTPVSVALTTVTTAMTPVSVALTTVTLSLENIEDEDTKAADLMDQVRARWDEGLRFGFVA
jgi:hypothetical protein